MNIFIERVPEEVYQEVLKATWQYRQKEITAETLNRIIEELQNKLHKAQAALAAERETK